MRCLIFPVLALSFILFALSNMFIMHISIRSCILYNEYKVYTGTKHFRCRSSFSNDLMDEIL